MSLWSDFRAWRKARAASPRPLDIIPSQSLYFGPGASHQPSHDTLLAESLGIPDAATRAIANRISGLELQVCIERRTEDGTTEDEILDDHPLQLLLDKPHPNFSRSKLLRLTAQWIVTVGEAYWQKVGNGIGLPMELHPIPPQMVDPLIERNVARAYRISDGNGRQSVIPADQMIRFFFPDPENPWKSEGYLGPNGIIADALKFSGEHLRAHYQNDATPRVVLEGEAEAGTPATEDLERFTNRWREYYSNRSGSRMGIPAMLPVLWKAHQLEAQTGSEIVPLLESWINQILIGYGVPKSVLGQVVSGDRSSAETNQWVFDQYSITPITSMISDDLTHQLAADFDASLRVEFSPFISEDKDYELKREAQDLVHFVRTINEVRTDRKLDPVPWGDDPVATSAEVPYDPEAASERVNRPPDPMGAPAEEPADRSLLAADTLKAKVRRLARENRELRRRAAA